MHTFLCYRKEMLNDPLLQITWKSYASSCKERGVFFASGPVVVGIIIAHSSHSWDFQNHMRWPDPTKLWKAHSVVYARNFQGFLTQTKRSIFCERYWRTGLWQTDIRSSQPERPLAGVLSHYVTQIQFDVKALIDEEIGSRAQALCQIHHSQKSPVNTKQKKLESRFLAVRVGEAAKPSSLNQTRNLMLCCWKLKEKK